MEVQRVAADSGTETAKLRDLPIVSDRSFMPERRQAAGPTRTAWYCRVMSARVNSRMAASTTAESRRRATRLRTIE